MGHLGIRLCIFFIYMTLRSGRADDYQTKCPGPLAFYNAIGMKPVDHTIADGCAYQYDCDEVKSLPLNKCYANRNAYDIGESLREEDSNPCDIGCTCASNATSGVSQFNCGRVDCFQGPEKPGCYRKHSPLQCCPGEEVCPENPEDRATCNVDGKVYRDGEYFSVNSDPDLNCVCQPGYEGKNVEPFCATYKRPECDALFTDPVIIKENCAPVYYSTQSPQTDCPAVYRCQNKQDMVLKSNKTKETQRPATVCYFGSLVMQYGDELNRDTDRSSVCVECVCEVGPTPTCQRLPDSDCDVTNTTFFNRLKDYGSSAIEKMRNNLMKK